MPGSKIPGCTWLRWFPLCLFLFINPGWANSTSLSSSLKNRHHIDVSSSEFFCGGGICGENLILNSLPFDHRYEFIDHPWTVQDSAAHLMREEFPGIVSLVIMLLAGQRVIHTFGHASRPFVSLGMQSVVDYGLSHNAWDFSLRVGSNALNYYVSGNKWSWWRQLMWFSAGHLFLPGVHWQDLRAQMGTQYEGQRPIHFTSVELDQLIELILDVSGSGGRRNGQFVIYLDQHNPVPNGLNGLEARWVNLLKACRSEGVTSVRLRPSSNQQVMLVQLWRNDHMLSETDLQLAFRGEAGGEQPVWLSEWLIRRTWPEGWQLGFDSLLLPLSDSVLGAVTKLVSHNQAYDPPYEQSYEPVQVVPVSGAVSPRGRMAIFSTGKRGYLLVDRNHTADVELPTMWLNTSEYYEDALKVSLAQLESYRIPGRERGKTRVAAEALRSLGARMVLSFGLKRGGFRSAN